MRKFIKNRDFLPDNLNINEERKMYKKYFILLLIVLNLIFIPLNIEVLYDKKNIKEAIPVYKEITNNNYYYENIHNIIEILNKDFIKADIVNDNGQIITDNLDIIYKIEEENTIKIKSIRKEEKLGYILEVEL